jgi:hypothetical protein
MAQKQQLQSLTNLIDRGLSLTHAVSRWRGGAADACFDLYSEFINWSADCSVFLASTPYVDERESFLEGGQVLIETYPLLCATEEAYKHPIMQMDQVGCRKVLESIRHDAGGKLKILRRVRSLVSGRKPRGLWQIMFNEDTGKLRVEGDDRSLIFSESRLLLMRYLYSNLLDVNDFIPTKQLCEIARYRTTQMTRKSLHDVRERFQTTWSDLQPPDFIESSHDEGYRISNAFRGTV